MWTFNMFKGSTDTLGNLFQILEPFKVLWVPGTLFDGSLVRVLPRGHFRTLFYYSFSYLSRLTTPSATSGDLYTVWHHPLFRSFHFHLRWSTFKVDFWCRIVTPVCTRGVVTRPSLSDCVLLLICVWRYLMMRWAVTTRVYSRRNMAWIWPLKTLTTGT